LPACMPSVLYHGTGSRYLESILNRGILPRNGSGQSQWGHTVESHPEAVYLSVCYPVHFAINALADDDLLIVEVDTSKLNPDHLVADEDALAFCSDGPETHGMTFLEKASFFRSRMHRYSSDFSLAQLGTCAHLGEVGPHAITRIAIVPQDQVKFLILGGFDATVSRAHFEIFGEEYASSMQWIFGDTDICAVNPRLPKLPIKVVNVSSSAG
jgi:hypothetical protein